MESLGIRSLSSHQTVGLVVVAAVAYLALLGAGSPARADGFGSVTYTYELSTPTHTYEVPAGVTRIEVTAVGAPGGAGVGANGGPGGSGARVVARLAVTPGEKLYALVGGAGDSGRADAYALDATRGGFNGGANSQGNGGGGGGASDVQTCSLAPADGCRTEAEYQASTLVSAGGGGGGGAGADAAGGAGGSARADEIGGPGTNGAPLDGAVPGSAGGGATRTTGGSAGADSFICSGGDEAGSGGIFFGGPGGALKDGGGGGGGGYYGGGGGSGGQSATCGGPIGGGGGGGGAGSSYGPAGTTFGHDTSRAARVTITPLFDPPTARIFWPANEGVYLQDETVPTGLSCSDSTGAPGIATCADSRGGAAPQGRLDTARLGRHAYSLTATSKDGQTSTITISYQVVRPATIVIETSHAVVTRRRTRLRLACTAGKPGDTCHGIISLQARIKKGSTKRYVMLGNANYHARTGDHANTTIRLTKQATALLAHARNHRLAARAVPTRGQTAAVALTGAP